MDEWIWTDADVAASLNASYVGVKLDGDLEKALVSRFKVAGYPTFIVLDPAGKEVRRFSGYMSARQTLGFLNTTPIRKTDLSADLRARSSSTAKTASTSATPRPCCSRTAGP